MHVSLFPMVLSFFAMLLVVSLFYSYIFMVFLVAVLMYLVVDLMYLEGNYDDVFIRPALSVGFYFFLSAEFMVFSSFLSGVIWNLNEGSVSLSSWSVAPALGCMLLFSSTLFLESFLEGGLANYDLNNVIVVLFCGAGFMIVSFYEFIVGDWSFLANPHVSSSLSALMFHLSHVILGLIGLVWWINSLSQYSIKDDLFGFVRFSYVAYYWHFVDFVWIFVYIVVYVR